MSQDGNYSILFYQDENCHGVSSDAYSDGHQQHVPHRASDPLDLLQFHRNINTANELLMQDLTKPINDTAWSSQLRSLPQQPDFSQSAWSDSGMAKMKAWTEPTPNQYIYLETAQKASDVSDSAYESMPTSGGAMDASYNTDGNELMGEYFAADLTHNLVESSTNANPPRSVKSEGQFLAPPNNSRRKQHVGPCCVPGCKKQPKNRSDARKHALTHSKPYRCEQLECNRKDGFATVNDLERHKKSVHNLLPRVGNPAGYICAGCHVVEGGQRKFWPRRDNFKAHVKRKHASYNEEQLLEASKQDARPDDAQTADGMSLYDAAARSAQQSQVDPVEGHVYQHMATFLAHPMVDHHEGPVFPPDSAIASQDDPFAFAGDHINDTQMLFGDQYDPLSPLQINPNFFPPPPSAQLLPAQHNSPPPRIVPVPTIHLTTSPPNEPHTTSHPTPPPPKTFPCPYKDCPKTKSRECDLRKHLKRHSRPYSCTAPSCLKNFGSRNDLKRHESSQHPEPRADLFSCPSCSHEPFRERGGLVEHFRLEHGGVLLGGG